MGTDLATPIVSDYDSLQWHYKCLPPLCHVDGYEGVLAKKKVPPVVAIMTCLLIVVLARYWIRSVLATSVTESDPCTFTILL